MTASDGPSLSLKDKAIIAAQGTLMAVPYIGSTLEHFICGPLNELRLKRIERTLAEITETLGPEKAKAAINEQFVSLLESIAPELSRSASETKRHRFRDLLTNAAELPDESDGWEEASLASRLLKEMEAPALAIIAGVERCEPSTQVTLSSRPVSQVFCGRLDYDNPGEPQHVLPYEWVVVEFWARWMREKQILNYQSHDARGGFGNVSLAQLGRFLVKWTMRDERGKRGRKS
jgi:hypothetical protein